MVTLILVRHAKSDWGSPGLADHERPLNDRGREDAPRMAEQVAASGVRPDRLFASTAVRAQSTAAEFSAALDVPVEPVADLYGASPSTLKDVAAASGSDTVLIVAHDPGLSDLASDLAGRELAMTTCAVATFTFASPDWTQALTEAPTQWRLDVPR